jgi:hypothetical protein
VRRISDQEINRTTSGYIAEVMQGALTRFVAIGQMPTSRAGTVVVIAVIGHDKRHRQVVGIDDALSGVGDIFTGSEHERVSWKRRFGRGV